MPSPPPPLKLQVCACKPQFLLLSDFHSHRAVNHTEFRLVCEVVVRNCQKLVFPYRARFMLCFDTIFRRWYALGARVVFVYALLFLEPLSFVFLLGPKLYCTIAKGARCSFGVLPAGIGPKILFYPSWGASGSFLEHFTRYNFFLGSPPQKPFQKLFSPGIFFYESQVFKCMQDRVRSCWCRFFLRHDLHVWGCYFWEPRRLVGRVDKRNQCKMPCTETSGGGGGVRAGGGGGVSSRLGGFSVKHIATFGQIRTGTWQKKLWGRESFKGRPYWHINLWSMIVCG